ncbi:MAG: SurA N-terminal domain-containing protein [Verrucomicrobia bacterium]|nr:SurA N-terminal domain-containing protein [Verrucomicrobiota bacterium]MCH8511966.1 SurA N-terminal domain-containing protein [Kiritimatiellia bacterium]
MMIMRFHKLIQSRLLWMVFLGIVVVSFVFMGAAEYSGGGGQNQMLRAPVAHIDGQPVSFLEFDTARRLLEINLQGQIPRDQLDDAVFERIAMVRFAQKLGLQVPRGAAEREYARELTDDEGRIDEALRMEYRDFFRSFNLTEEAQINYIREQMLVQDLQRVLTTFAVNTSFDAERWAAMETDLFETSRIQLTEDLLPEPISLTDGDVEAYFEENRPDFTLPEQRKVHYITYNVSDFTREDDVMSEADARAFFDSNPNRFMRPVQSETPDGEMTWEMKPRAFDEVKTEIMDSYRSSRARERAKEEALSLAVRLTPRRGRPAPEIETVAADLELSLQTTRFFAKTDFLENIPNSNRFTQAAFNLDESEIGRTSQPVDGRDHVYILQLAEIRPAREPELFEVVEEVREQAKAHLTRQALEKYAEELKAELQVHLDAGVSFAEAAANLGLEPEEVMPFQLEDAEASGPMFPMDVAEKAGAYTTGDLFGPVEDPRFETLSLVYVNARTPQPEDRQRWIEETAPMIGANIEMQGFIEYFRDQVLRRNLKKTREGSPEQAL